jgi:DNA-binding LacI/PurR family transcriptional regulator
VSGVVFAGGLYAMADAPHDHYRRLSERRLPVVLLNAGIEHLGFPRVSCDDTVAVEQGVAHLRSLGHERIGLVLGTSDHVPSRRKREAFRAVLAGRGERPGDDVVEHTLFSIEGGQVAAGKLIDRGVTGILCASDLLALGSVRAARRRDRSVPQQVSIVGYDDSQLMTCAAPPLTTIRQPIEAMGRAAVELLVSQIEGTTVAVDELLYEPELVVRGSTGPVR